MPARTAAFEVRSFWKFEMGNISRRKKRRKETTDRTHPTFDQNFPNSDTTASSKLKKVLIFSCLCLLLVPLVLWSANWLREPAEVLVKGTIERAESLKTSFSTDPENGTSLGCGCMKPQTADYRGIGVISNELYFSNGNDHGGFGFFATTPGPTSIVPALSFEGTAFQIAVDDLSQKMDSQRLHAPEVWRQQNPFSGFSPGKLLDPAFKNAKIVSTFKFRDAYSLHLKDVRDIHVSQFGLVPFVAWNPTAGGRLHLSFDHGQGEISITEAVDERIPDIKEMGDGVSLGTEIIHPVTDLVGIPLLIWTDRTPRSFSTAVLSRKGRILAGPHSRRLF